jgi:hypothetical protein
MVGIRLAHNTGSPAGTCSACPIFNAVTSPSPAWRSPPGPAGRQDKSSAPPRRGSSPAPLVRPFCRTSGASTARRKQEGNDFVWRAIACAFASLRAAQSTVDCSRHGELVDWRRLTAERRGLRSLARSLSTEHSFCGSLWPSLIAVHWVGAFTFSPKPEQATFRGVESSPYQISGIMPIFGPCTLRVM